MSDAVRSVSLALLFVSFLMLFWIPAYADGLKVTSQLKEDPMAVITKSEQRKNRNDEFCAMIVVTANTEGLRFKSNKGIEDEVYENGKYKVFISPGDKGLEVSKEGYVSTPIPSERIRFEPNRVYTVTIELERDMVIRELVRDDLKGRLDVSSTPLSAELIIDGRSIGLTPKSEYLSEGWHYIQIRKENHLDAFDSVYVIKDTVIKRHFPLIEDFGWLNLSSEPENDAIVTINPSGLRRKTPFSEQLRPEKYSLVVEKIGYKTMTREVSINRKQETPLVVNMEKAFAPVRIEADPEDAEIWINGKVVVRGVFDGFLSKETHRIDVVRKYYETKTLNLSVRGNEMIRQKLSLDRQKGSLVINIQPPDVLFEWEGKIESNVFGNVFYRDSVPAGKYSISFQKEGYMPFSLNFEVTSDQTRREQVVLSDQRMVRILTPDFYAAKLKINGKEDGTTPRERPLKIGKYVVEVTHPEAFPKMDTILVTPEDSVFRIEMISLSDCPSIIDYQGDLYETTEIGGSCWFSRNLNVGIYQPSTHRSRDNDIIEKYCYGDNPENCREYGGLYTWAEAMMYGKYGPQGICPDYWHVASDHDWRLLEQYLDSTLDMNDWDGLGYRSKVAGNKLKAVENWPKDLTLDLYHFSILPGGYMDNGGGSWSEKKEAYFWTSTATSGIQNRAFFRALKSGKGGIRRGDRPVDVRFSVRCIKDSEVR